MNRALLMVVLVCALLVGCGSGKAKVRGRLVENGQPTTFPPTTLALELAPVGEDDQPDKTKLYPAVVNEDGTFEVVASGGEVPLGKYAISIQATGKYTEKLKAFAPGASRIRREIKAGTNDLTIDLAKPQD